MNFLTTSSSQNQQLLQLLRDCLHGATANLTPTVNRPCKASNPTASQDQQLLQLPRDCLHGATHKPYSYCTSTTQSFKSYCFSGPTIITTPKRLLHGATANLNPTVLPLCKASNPTASQDQQLLQLLRDCYMVLLQTLILLYFHYVKLQILHEISYTFLGSSEVPIRPDATSRLHRRLTAFPTTPQPQLHPGEAQGGRLSHHVIGEAPPMVGLGKPGLDGGGDV